MAAASVKRAAACLALLGLTVGCADSSAPGGPDDGPSAGSNGGPTRGMIDRLATYIDGNDYTRHIVALDSQPAPSSEEELLQIGATRSYYLLQAGRHEEASAEVLSTIQAAERSGTAVTLGFRSDLRDLLALSAMWGTFEDACMRDTEACLLPLDPRAYGPEVSLRLEAADVLYRGRLEEDPEDVVAQWLLNLAHMALGDYPQGVPEPWRIEPGEFYEGAEFPRFPERAAELGVDLVGHAGGIIFDDLDNDDDFDLLISSRGLADSIRYFENRDGAFIDRTVESGLHGLVGGLNLLQGDYDNDGDEDVFALRGAWTPDGQPNSLFRNEGGGRFTDVT
ncbi:MAG: VCBS repeat-containing protein, partial [Gemmatimonadota bacterium]|nr:VCBS repeat-containing protein [Gemmatimonadota bacterium]